MNFDPYTLSYQDACAYIEYITSFTASANTVKNKISQVRVHLSLVDVTSDVWSHPRVIRAVDAVERDKQCVPRSKDPLPPSVFRDILDHLVSGAQGNIVRAALLVLYYGALRQSELFPRTVSQWDPTKHPMRKDLVFSEQACTIYVKFGKNMQKAGQHRLIELSAVQDHRLCPVQALRRMVTDIPSQSDNSPLFMFPISYKPVPASYVSKEYHAALALLQVPDAKRRFSLHSLRKAAATNAFSSGCSELSIKRYGGWSSSAYTSYIETSNRSVNQSLISAII